MSRLRRKFSLEEKLQILNEADHQGIEVTLRKYQLSRSLYYKWKNSFDRQGTDGLTPNSKQVGSTFSQSSVVLMIILLVFSL